MRILIAGGSGFLGSHLSTTLAAAGHTISILTRQPSPVPSRSTRLIPWTPTGSSTPWASTVGPVDAVINLAGASIADGRWSAARKAALVSSRLDATRALVHFIRQASPAPAVFISASAVGYYGNRGDDELTEADLPGDDFLAQLCTDWEAAALDAKSPATRVVRIRTGLVLDADAGALPRMLLPFRMGLGGPLGSGRQFMSWIHRDDWVGLISWILGNDSVDGALNATAPNPVTNADFGRTLGRVLRRPAIMPAPAFVLNLALGEMAEALLLFSQRVRPARALAGGYRFARPTLDAALADLLKPRN